VIERANKFGVKKMLFAAGYIEDAKISYQLSKRSEHFYATVGIHPCRALEPYKSINQDFGELT
jgi:TatD DNase family protein